MVTMRMWLRRNMHPRPIIDQCRMRRTEGIVGDVDGYECEQCDDADPDEEEEASQADDGSTQNVDD
jgi:hypothetical protein